MKASINSLHHQENDWLRELEFYKQELVLLTNRLGEVAAKNSSGETLAQVEHFQNRFILLKEQHDILRHDNAERLNRLNEMAAARPEHIDEKFLNNKDDMQKRMSDYFSSFRDTRFEFNSFLSKVL